MRVLLIIAIILFATPWRAHAQLLRGEVSSSAIRHLNRSVWFYVAGASNAVGLSKQTQLDSNPSADDHVSYAWQLNDELKLLNDPFYPNADPGARKSPWPTLASLWSSEIDRPVSFILGAAGGACLCHPQELPVEEDSACPAAASVPRWDKEANGDLYCMMDRQIDDVSDAVLGKIDLRAVLWHGGECEMNVAKGASVGIGTKEFKAALRNFAAHVEHDFGVPVVVANLYTGDWVNHVPSDVAALRLAIVEAVAEDDNIFLGPETKDLDFIANDIHIDDYERLGERWFNALKAAGLVYAEKSWPSLGLLVPSDFALVDISPNRVDLSWATPPPNTTIDRYKILRDGVEVGTSEETRFSDVIGVQPEHSYTYEVRSVDAVGIESDGVRLDAVTPALTGLPVFPGAAGFGSTTVAGRGGTVYTVESLSGDVTSPPAGTFGYCVQQSGPRVCIFEVSGVIELEGYLTIANPYITIAGQTAPSPGITIKENTLRIQTHDVLIQHIRVRPGSPEGIEPTIQDGMALSNGTYNVIVDHCSISWAIDENLAFGVDASNSTVSHSIISEGLYRNMHPQGDIADGILVREYAENIALINNLFAHNRERNPRIVRGATALVANNLTYNALVGGPQVFGIEPIGPASATLVANVFVPGLDTNASHSDVRVQRIGCHFPLVFSDDWTNVTNTSGPGSVELFPPLWTDRMRTRPANTLQAWLFDTATSRGVGARPDDRDAIDARVVADVVAGTGHWIDCGEAGDLAYDSGTAQAGGARTITLEAGSASSKYDDAYVGRDIHITGGVGVGERETVSEYDGATRIATVAAPWGVQPVNGSTYEIIVDCTNNGGGWPGSTNTRALTLPASPTGDDDGDGYTNLEEWLHSYAADLEGQ